MAANVDWDEFRLDIDGARVIAPCFQLECHTWFAEGVGDFYRRARSALGDLITHYETESTDGARPLDARAETIVPTWVERTKPGKTYWIEFRGCERERGVTPASITLFFYQTPPTVVDRKAAEQAKANYRRQHQEWGRAMTPFVMTLRVTCPVEHPLAEPAQAIAWILELEAVRGHPFLTGHAGYALNIDHTRVGPAVQQTRNKARSLLLRHPGLDWYRPSSAAELMLRYDAEQAEFFPIIVRADWLNLISDDTLKRLGGRERALESLAGDRDVVVHELPHGVALQAGPEPQPGDLGRRDFLPAYRRVASVLRPVRLEDSEKLAQFLTDELAGDWLNAFDVDYES